MAELTADLTGRSAVGRVYVDPSTTYVEQGDGGSAPAALTNSLSDTTVDGELEALEGIGTVSVSALSRNLSELNAKIDEILAALATANITT